MIEALVKSIVTVTAILAGSVCMMWVERKIMARFQSRRDPSQIGSADLLQPLADGLKLIFKQEWMPAQADRIAFILAPVIALAAVLLLFAVVPMGSAETALRLADINVAALYVLAMMAVAIYGVVLAGWASDNRFALWSGLRAAAHTLSYQLPLALAMAGVLLLSGSMSLGDIVERQRDVGVWFIFLQPVPCSLFLITMLVEAEPSLAAGYYAEYNGVKFALFFIAQYIKGIALCALVVTLFFGAWLPPFPNLLRGLWQASGGFGWLSPLWFGTKVMVLLTALVWVRAALPRLRYDQLMRLSWKFMLPLSLLNVVVTAGLMAALDV